MNFDFIPKAEASVNSLINTINKVVVNPIIYFLFTLGTILFLYGIVRFFLNPANEDVKKESKNHMLWGLVGMLIMISVFGIMNLIVNTIGA